MPKAVTKTTPPKAKRTKGMGGLQPPAAHATNVSAFSEVASGLFELETPLLRIRDLVHAASIMAGSTMRMPKEAGEALDALAQTILDAINDVLEERTRLWHLAKEFDSVTV